MPGYETWITLDATVIAMTTEFQSMDVEKRKCKLQAEDPFKDDPIKLTDVSYLKPRSVFYFNRH